MAKKIAQFIFFCFAFSFLLVMVQCNSSQKKQKAIIGFSQCTMDDVWRVQMLQEMERETEIINDIDFQILLKDATNNSSQQIKDIRTLVKDGIDILIVSANQAKPLQHIIDSVSNLNIPVILIDRFIQTDSDLHFIGANNYNIGKMAGQEAFRLLPDGGKVLIFSGLNGSMPTAHRQKGFMENLRLNNKIHYKRIRSDWTENTAYKQMLEVIQTNQKFDLIFTHNDFMARGVIKALNESDINLPPIIGIDGLNAPGCGIDMLLDSSMAATITYPTGGDVAIQTAYNILTNKPIEQNITLNSILITPENAGAIKMQRDEIEQQYSKIDRQNAELLTKEQEIADQKRRITRIVILLSISFILFIGLFYFMRKKNVIVSADPEDKVDNQFKIPTVPEAKDDDRKFITEIESLINENLSHKDLSVLFIGEKLGMSHSTIYRKIKKLTGLTGVELIKLIRLNTAAQLLKSSNLSIEEIAFQTGFNTASYFSTSFVKQFGLSPVKFRKE